MECILHKRQPTLHTYNPFPIQSKINDKPISVGRENHVKEKIHCVNEKSDLLGITAYGTHSYNWADIVTEGWAKWNVNKYTNLTLR